MSLKEFIFLESTKVLAKVIKIKTFLKNELFAVPSVIHPKSMNVQHQMLKKELDSA